MSEAKFREKFDKCYSQCFKNDENDENDEKNEIINEPEFKEIQKLYAKLGEKNYEFKAYIFPKKGYDQKILVSKQYKTGPYKVVFDKKLISFNRLKDFEDITFSNFEDIKKELYYYLIYDICEGNPNNFLIYKLSNMKYPLFYVRCPKCKKFTNSDDSISDIENDNTEEKYRCKLFNLLSYSPCPSCNCELYNDYELLQVEVDEDLMKRINKCTGSLDIITTYAEIYSH